MYNTLQRMYNMAYYAAQCLGVAVIFLYLSSLLLYVPPETSVKFNKSNMLFVVIHSVNFSNINHPIGEVSVEEDLRAMYLILHLIWMLTLQSPSIGTQR